MKQLRWKRVFLCVALLVAVCTVNAEVNEVVQEAEVERSELNASLVASQANWVFAGIVTNESGDAYHYYFQMEHRDTEFHAVVALIDAQSKAVLFFEDSNTIITQPLNANWQVGRAFLKFNPINDSWIFGIKTKEKAGFNFKIDMLREAITKPTIHNLRTGVELLVTQTSRLNGHVQLGKNKEQFVTAKKAWFKQIWISKPLETLYPLRGVLCQFNDGSGFYAVNLLDPGALKGAIAGWRDPQGQALTMSQFVTVEPEKENIWHIKVALPKMNLLLENALSLEKIEKPQLIAGLIEGLTPGFCTISNDEIGQRISS